MHSRKSLSRSKGATNKNTTGLISLSKLPCSLDKSNKKNVSLKPQDKQSFKRKINGEENMILEKQIQNLRKQLKNLKQVQKNDKYLILDSASEIEDPLKNRSRSRLSKSKPKQKRELDFPLQEIRKKSIFDEKRDSKSKITKKSLNFKPPENLNESGKNTLFVPKRQQFFLNKKSIEETKTHKIGEFLIKEKEKNNHLERSTSKTNIANLKQREIMNFCGNDEQPTDDHHRKEEICHPLIQEKVQKQLQESSSKVKLGKNKIKPKKEKAQLLVKSKQKNSLKDLLEEYTKLKDHKIAPEDEVELERLQKMKQKLNSIQNLVEMKLKKVSRPMVKKISRQEKAAIVIQKYTRGFLVRKFLRNYILATNPTLESFDPPGFENNPTKSSAISIENFDIIKNQNLITAKEQGTFKRQDKNEKIRLTSPKNLTTNKIECQNIVNEVELNFKKEQKVNLKSQIKESFIGKEFSQKVYTLSGHQDQKLINNEKCKEMDKNVCNMRSQMTNPQKTINLDKNEIMDNKKKITNVEIISKKQGQEKINEENMIKKKLLLTNPYDSQKKDQKLGLNDNFIKQSFIESSEKKKKNSILEEAQTDIKCIPIERLITKECQNWESLNEVLNELNQIMGSKKQTDEKFQNVIHKINTMTLENIKTLKQVLVSSGKQQESQQKPDSNHVDIRKNDCQNVIDPTHNNYYLKNNVLKIPSSPRSTSQICKKNNEDHIPIKTHSFKTSHKTLCVEVWPEIKQNKVHSSNKPILAFSNSVYFEKPNESEDKFFYTDRDLSNNVKNQNNFQETISRDLSKTSFDIKNGNVSLNKNQINVKPQNNENVTKKIDSKSNFSSDNFLDKLPKFSQQELKKVISISSNIDRLSGFEQKLITPVNGTNKKEFIFEPVSSSKKKLESAIGLSLKNSVIGFECIEVPIEKDFKDIPNKIAIFEEIFENLVLDLIEEPIWHDCIAVMFFKNQVISQNEEHFYGIRTNISAVNEYCNLLSRFLDEKLQKFLPKAQKMIVQKTVDRNFSLGKIERAVLEFIDISTDISWQKRSSSELILDEDDYLDLESQILENYKNMNILEDIFEMQRIYHRCIFDSFNEIVLLILIDSPKYKLVGEERDIFEGKLTEQKLSKVFIKARNFLLENTLTMCGLIKDKEDSMLGKSVKNFDAESVKIIREERLMKLLTEELTGDWFDGEKNLFRRFIEVISSEICLEVEKFLFKDLSSFLNV